MSLKEHEVQNVKLKPRIIERIKEYGNKVSNKLKRKKVLKYGIQSTDGTIWDNLDQNKLTSLYSLDREEYILLSEEYSENDILYHNLINNTYYSPKEFLSIMLGRYNAVDIGSYVDKQDIMFANICPVIDAKALKEKVERTNKNNVEEIRKKF